MTGVTPGRLILFVSSVYFGRASDKLIFEDKKLIDKLESRDARKFLIDDLCALRHI